MARLMAYRNGSVIPNATIISFTNTLANYTSAATIEYVQSSTSALPTNLDSLIIKNDLGATLWGGYVASYKLSDNHMKVGAVVQILITLTCRDYRMLTDAAVVTADYTSIQDSSMIQQIFTASGITSITVSPTNLANINFLAASFSNNTITDAMNQICKATGGNWFIDPNKNLFYVTSDYSNNPGPYALSDNPDYSTSFEFSGDGSFQGDFFTPCNYCIVMGGVDKHSLTPIVATASNAASIALYGTWKQVVQDNTIHLASTAQAIANQYVTQRGVPQRTMSVVTYWGGLVIGQVMQVTKASYGMAAVQMQIQSILTEQTHATGTTRYSTKYTLQLGDYYPTLTDQFITGTQPIVNPVFSPVNPYTPMDIATVGPIDPRTTGFATVNVVNITNTSGRLKKIRVSAKGGVNSITAGAVWVGIEITIDGQPTRLYYPIMNQSANAVWNPDLVATFTPGAFAGSLSVNAYAITDGSSVCMDFDLDHAISLRVDMVFINNLITGNIGKFSCSVMRAERIVPV